MNEQQFLTVDALNQNGLVRHAFTTRQNGLGGRTSGVKSADDWKAVAVAFGIGPDRVVTVNQVHGDGVVRVNAENYRSLGAVQADALFTSARELAIGVETADCVPVLLYDPAGPAVAAIHAGWRSTVKKIVRKAVGRMQEELGSDPSRMLAAIGPAIGPECYEVDGLVMGPVREAFPFWTDVAAEQGAGKWRLDLAKANRLELMEAGLPGGSIHSLGLCTSCRRDLFYSFRAEGRTGRMLSVIMLKP